MATQGFKIDRDLEGVELPKLRPGYYLWDWLRDYAENWIEFDGDISCDEHLRRRSAPRVDGGLVEFDFKVDVIGFAKQEVTEHFSGEHTETGLYFWGELQSLSDEMVAVYKVRPYSPGDERRCLMGLAPSHYSTTRYAHVRVCARRESAGAN